MTKKVCHITTAHPATDVRIFYKECVSLVKAGYDVTLIAPNATTAIKDGVKIMGVEMKSKSRISRMTAGAKAVYGKALEIDADIYHFHDPEFLRYGLKLKKQRKVVVYDVHEDLPRQVLAKHYIPTPIRRLVATAIEWHEDRVAGKLD